MQHSNREAIRCEVGARSSPLSQAQVKELHAALQCHYPAIQFDIHYMKTTGDNDQVTSLRTLDRTDFFTKEIDQWVLQGKGRIGVHSAKDLPVPLPKGLAFFCLTRGIDPSDSLVLRSQDTLSSLPIGAKIATSSIRREETVKQLRQDLCFCDVRGTIEQRLAKLHTREVDGVVIAEAALIRLGLTHLNRLRLPGKTAEGQGQLAVVGREEDQEIKKLFACLDIRAHA